MASLVEMAKEAPSLHLARELRTEQRRVGLADTDAKVDWLAAAQEMKQEAKEREQD
jgi:hypothetical protein